MSAAVRSTTPALALTTAAAIAFTPLVMPLPATHHFALPRIATPRVELTGVIDPADVTKLVDNLQAAMASASTTVTGLVGTPGQTLTQALTSAVALNNTLWDGLIAATDSKPLAAILRTLKASAGNGLSDLSKSVDDVNGTIVLTTGQLADLLTSTLTGSLGTALHAVATVINNPLALPSYTGLINTPIDLAGLVLTQGIGTVNHLGANVLTVTNTLVAGVTSQVSNALDTFNGLLDAGKQLTGIDLVNGLITAVQGIVSAPVAAAVAAVNGASTTLTNAATTVLDRLADGASDAVTTWVGNGTDAGAIQQAINTIGAAPLSPASYAHAVSVLVGAGISTVKTAAHTVGSLASVPFTAGADITTATANVITAFTSGLATAASGILQAAGLPSLVAGIPHAMAATVNALVNVAAATTAAGLRTIGAALDFGSAITGALNATATAPAARKTVTLNLTQTEEATPTADRADATTHAPAASHDPETAAAQPKGTAADDAKSAAPAVPVGDTAAVPAEPTAAQPPKEPDATTPAASGVTSPSSATKDAPKSEASTHPATGTENAGTATPAGAHDPDATANGNTAAGPKPRLTAVKGTAADTTPRSPSSTPGAADKSSDTTTKTPKHASATSPRHAAASHSAPKHAA